ncbi:tetrahydromethanopterin S-methyltransferase subunit F [Candidatus Hecatella orcuttiae]|uniref:tetrahydromethanopterin S-methyltransferase subunit F n=1 Tax=Candidatus Hecatella orcuttiae TaxID=1935119 RepID=UPI002867DAAF|nr:tetrahydromethanopterin S-methyltransferase subunit F [Candidatus Hecatella orcuttiae]
MEKAKRRAVETLYTPEMALIEARIHDLKTRLLLIGRENRFAAGFYGGLVKGFMWGMIISLLLFGVIFAYFIP